MKMRTLASLLLTLSVLAGVALKVEAQAVNSETTTDMNANDSKYLDQMDREGRGGQGQG
jgi:hypothetical protein